MKSKEVDKPKQKVWIYVSIIFLILIIVSIFGIYYFMNRNNGSYSNNYQPQEQVINHPATPICRTVYETQTTTEPKLVETPFQYTTAFRDEKYGVFNDYDRFWVIVTNLEDRGGEFQVKFTINFRDGGQEIWNSPAQFIGSRQTYSFISHEYKNRYPTSTYDVIPAKKQEIVNQQVTKQVERQVCE